MAKDGDFIDALLGWVFQLVGWVFTMLMKLVMFIFVGIFKLIGTGFKALFAKKEPE